MNAIRVYFSFHDELNLPIAYHALLQGLLYSVWKETQPYLHEQGFSGGGRGLRLFTFSPLFGRYALRGDRIVFSSPVWFELRSPVSVLLEDICEVLPVRPDIRLGNNTLTLEGIEGRDRLLFPARAKVRMLSPVTLYQTLPNQKTRYFSPDDAEWGPRLEKNLREKLTTLGLDASPSLLVTPDWRSIRKRVTRFKGTYITGYTGDFLIQTEPEALAVLYYCGLGSRNSQGCGMFKLLRQRDLPPEDPWTEGDEI